MSARGVAIASLMVVAAAVVPAGCRVGAPTNRPIEACLKACATHAARQCSEADCERGCEFILDRLVEKEMHNVMACMARTPRRCTDIVWADCASRIGDHADGGPPAPPPPVEEE